MIKRFMIYGANGYTGRLIVKEAVKRGMKPVLAGRNRDQLDAMAKEYGLTRRLFELNRVAEIARNLEDVPLVLNCAGPFSKTASPMLESCLSINAHYLDITGEISVFETCHHAHARAKHQRVVVAPGTGFDVVPTDCLAAMLKQRMPDANSLVLAFEAGGGPSPGTAKTSVEGLGSGGRARVNGELVEVPLAWKTRTFVRDGMPRTAMTIPWGDVYTAFVSTGIPDIETYMAMPPRAISVARRLRMLRPLLRLAPVQAWLKARAGARPGPDDARRAKTDCRVWGEARDATGRLATMQIATPNGYALTAWTAPDIAARVLAQPPAGGYFTPSQLMGSDYVLRVPGVSLVEDA
jgi:short subunit dehydrogenase-like uncharacterized protein